MRIFAEIGGRETQCRATLGTSFGANGDRDQLIGLPSRALSDEPVLLWHNAEDFGIAAIASGTGS